MDSTAETLRRRIALYRRYLREGVDAELAGEYLKTITADEAALAKIEAQRLGNSSEKKRS